MTIHALALLPGAGGKAKKRKQQVAEVAAPVPAKKAAARRAGRQEQAASGQAPDVDRGVVSNCSLLYDRKSASACCRMPVPHS